VSELPLFPLYTVLFPDGLLHLRIFEPRYTDMVGRCMREGSPFGVVLILSGAEAGAAVETAELGTTARIADFSGLPDGLLGVTCKGERRFRILKRWQLADGLNVADVEYLATEVAAEVPQEYQHLADLLRKILPQLGEPYASMAGDFADASWVGCRLAEILPVALADKLSLLRIDDPVGRLAQLASVVRNARQGQE
jgi:Lon protease-like protein